MAFISIPGAHNAVLLGGSPSSNTADQKCASLPASCDRWTADPRFPWLRRFSRLHRELSARLGRLPPWRRRKRSGLRDDVATGARSGRPVRSSLGPTPAAATWLPAHAGEARGEGRPTVTLREPHRCFQELPETPLAFPSPPTSPPGFGTATAGPPGHAAASAQKAALGRPATACLAFRQARVHGTANYNSHAASRTQTPRPARFRSAASLPFLPDCGLVNRFVLGRGLSTVPPKPLAAHNPFLSCWEVYADAFASRGADTASHVIPRWRCHRSSPCLRRPRSRDGFYPRVVGAAMLGRSLQRPVAWC